MLVPHFSQVVPCYTRKSFLQKYAIATNQKCDFNATLSTQEGFSFDVKVTNTTEKTFLMDQTGKNLLQSTI